MKTICGTGHRPNKLGGYSKPVFESYVSTASEWLRIHRPEVVISGMALGWDQALAVAATRLGIETHAYIPCVGQEAQWPPDSQNYYDTILRMCAVEVLCTEGPYSSKAMQVRNERMVNASDLVLAMWDGSYGGTANCIRYAENKRVPIINLWDVHHFVV